MATSLKKELLLSYPLRPEESINISLPIKKSMKAGKEYFLNVRYTLKEAEPFLEKGYEVAYEQFALAQTAGISASPAVKGKIKPATNS
jgi:beta-galactosidase